MGRRRLLTVLTATVLSVGALSIPASAVDLNDAVEETSDTAESVTSNPAAPTAESVETVTDTATDDAEAVGDLVEDGDTDPVEELVEEVAGTVEDAAEDPPGTVEDLAEDPEGTIGDLVAPVTDPSDDDTGAADDDGVEPAPEPEGDRPSTGPGTSPGPSFGDMLTAPSMDHRVVAAPSSSRSTDARAAAPAEVSDPAPELAPEVAVQAAAPDVGALGPVGETVPVLLRVLTAMLVAGAAITWRTVQKGLAD